MGKTNDKQPTESFDDFLESELSSIEEQKQQRMEAGDYKPWTTINVGSNIFEFVKRAPRPHTSYPNRMVFRVFRDGQEMDLAVSKTGRLYTDIIKVLSEAKNKPGNVKVEVTRIGTGRTDTRYALKAIE